MQKVRIGSFKGFCWVMVLSLALSSIAAEVKSVGNWKVSFDEPSATFALENAARLVRMSGPLTFVSSGRTWKVAAARDAATDRLSLVNPAGRVLGYVSFRGDGDRVAIEVFHRAGANFFPGLLTWRAEAEVREISFACRTFTVAGERVLNFGDGTADASVNDSVFAREEDLAVRFASARTRIRTLGGGRYAVTLAADIDEPSRSTIAIEADTAYFKSRWAPGYHPIDRRRCPRAPTGWMSWNTYFDKAGSAENLAEARIGAKCLKPFGLEIWSIESWQDNSEWLPVSTFHHHENRCFAKQFPEGMKRLADEIRALGFRPGLWMSLYGEGDERFYQAHRDLYLHDKSGKPIDNWAGRHMLDTTNPDALALMTRLARQASEEWGYEFFKFDGMANTPRKFELPEIRACAKNPSDSRWFENSVRALREGIGPDRLFLGCMGDFTGTEAQFLDASRLGSDVVGCYRSAELRTYPGCAPSPWCQLPVRWRNVLHQAECTFTQVFVNNLMFYTDPDTLLVNESLELHEAEVMATIIGLPGQLMFAGDKLGELRPNRMKIIQQVLPVADIHPRNLYPYAASSMIPIWNLVVTRSFGDWNVVAVFNWKDEPQDLAVTLEELGLDDSVDHVAWEFWQGEFLGPIKGSISLRVPMRSVKLLAVRPEAAHPQFVGDDRHVTQGAVELTDLKWDKAARKYTLGVKAIGGFPFTYFVRVPAGFALKGAVADNARVAVGSRPNGVLAVRVESAESREVSVMLQF